MGPLCGQDTQSAAEHNFLTESIKALHVYSRIMIVVNKLMQTSRSHGISVNKGGWGGWGDNGREWGKEGWCMATQQRP